MNPKSLVFLLSPATALLATPGCERADPPMVASAPGLPPLEVLEAIDLNSVPEQPWWTVPAPASGSPPTTQTGPTSAPETQPPETTVQVPSDLLFDVGSSQLSLAARSQLASVVRLVQSRPTSTLTISGFTDGDGSDAFNQRLSERRAQAVAAWLESQGIAAERITSRGFGEADPIAPNDTASAQLSQSQGRDHDSVGPIAEALRSTVSSATQARTRQFPRGRTGL